MHHAEVKKKLASDPAARKKFVQNALKMYEDLGISLSADQKQALNEDSIEKLARGQEVRALSSAIIITTAAD